MTDAAGSSREDRFIEIGIVARPHGVKGELRVNLHNKDSDVLLDIDEVRIVLANGDTHEVSVDAARRADQAILLTLYSIGNRDRAEELRGARIFVKRSDFPPLDDGEFYACDVEGARALVDTREGVVKELVNYPSVDVLVIELEGSTYEVPLVEAFVENVDVKAGVVRLVTLEGVEPNPKPRAKTEAATEEAVTEVGTEVGTEADSAAPAETESARDE